MKLNDDAEFAGSLDGALKGDIGFGTSAGRKPFNEGAVAGVAGVAVFVFMFMFAVLPNVLVAVVEPAPNPKLNMGAAPEAGAPPGAGAADEEAVAGAVGALGKGKVGAGLEASGVARGVARALTAGLDVPAKLNLAGPGVAAFGAEVLLGAAPTGPVNENPGTAGLFSILFIVWAWVGGTRRVKRLFPASGFFSPIAAVGAAGTEGPGAKGNTVVGAGGAGAMDAGPKGNLDGSKALPLVPVGAAIGAGDAVTGAGNEKLGAGDGAAGVGAGGNRGAVEGFVSAGLLIVGNGKSGAAGLLEVVTGAVVVVEVFVADGAKAKPAWALDSAGLARDKRFAAARSFSRSFSFSFSFSACSLASFSASFF